MLRRGKAPYLECSSKGDKRFSAFCAYVGPQSIEAQYQAAKVFEDGSTGLSWREAKGRQAVNMPRVSKLYKILWIEYLRRNPDLIPLLVNASGLSDMFGQEGHNCQADILWQFRNWYINASPMERALHNF